MKRLSGASPSRLSSWLARSCKPTRSGHSRPLRNGLRLPCPLWLRRKRGARLTPPSPGESSGSSFRIRKDVVYTAIDDRAVLGSAQVRVTRDGYGYIHGLIVNTQHRGHGTARALMTQVLSDFRHIRLELIAGPRDESTDRKRLIRFYSSLGFRLGPTVRERDARDSDQYRMFRDGEMKDA